MNKAKVSYKATNLPWCPEIPEHWKLKKLKYVARVQPSNVDKKTEVNEIPVKLCNYVDVYKNDFITDSIDFMDASATKDEIEKFRLAKSDVLITKDSETPQDIAVPALVKIEKDNLVCGYHLAQIRSDNSKIIGEYLFRLFQSKNFNSTFEIAANGITRFGLSIETIKSVSVFLPPLREQQRIAEYLDKKTEQIDQLIANKEKLIECLKEERTAIINQAVTKGINPNAKLKPSAVEWIGEIPEDWEVKKLKYVAKINSSNKHRYISENPEQTVIFLPMEKVYESGHIDQELTKKVKDAVNGFTYFEKGDIIVAKITPCFENGKGALLDNLKSDFGFGSTEFHTLRAGNNLDRRFLYFITKTELFMNMGEALMTGAAGQKRVPTEFLKNFLIAVPPKKTQVKIVDFIHKETNKIDQTTSVIAREIELIKEYKIALINEVVTGKKLV